MQFIKFNQPDPDYTANVSEVAVNVGQIVKIEPKWGQLAKDGIAWRIHVGPDDDSAALLESTCKWYLLYDSLGNKYLSLNASPEGQQIIENLWRGLL